jgi:hypothetical protein
VDGAHRHLGVALGIDEARRVRLARRLLERNVAARVPFEQLDDQRRDRRIGGDDLFTVRAGNVAIAERTLVGQMPCSAFSCIPLRASSDRLSMSIERKIRGMNPAARELAIQAGCEKAASISPGVLPSRVPRLLVELLAHVLVAVGGIVAYAPIELKRLV